jgi:hypothetical protein
MWYATIQAMLGKLYILSLFYTLCVPPHFDKSIPTILSDHSVFGWVETTAWTLVMNHPRHFSPQ